MSRYTYKKTIYKYIFSVIDVVGSLYVGLFRRAFPSDIKKILVVRLDHIGDVIFSIPVYEAIKVAKPDVSVSVVTTSDGKEILFNNPYIDEIIVFDSPWFSRGKKKIGMILPLIRFIRKKEFDLAFELRGDVRNILLLRFSGVKYIVSYGITGGRFLIDKEIKWNPGLHQIDRNMEFITIFGGSVCNFSPPKIYLSEDEFEHRWAEEITRSIDKPIIVYHIGAGTQAKRWPIERFIELIKRVKNEYNIQTVLIGGKELVSEIKPFLSEINDYSLNLIGKTTIRQLLHFLKKSSLLISSDSGPLHLGVALGLQTIGIWSGTNDPKVWAPESENFRLVYKEIRCQGCEKKYCSHKTCLQQISVNDVFQVISQIIQR